MSKKTTSKSRPTAKSVSTSQNSEANAPINTKLSKEEKIEIYRNLVRIRRFEERTLRAYQQGKIGGFLHLYIGQEAIAVGTTSLMGPDDHVITAYRDHGHALAVGMSMNECMAELQGKHTGCSKGKGGSMHFFAPDKNYWGGHGIVGGQTPLGAGIAFALKHEEKKGCCMCFLGDGAVNQGVVHESLNLAGLWELPVIYIIENNQYSMGTSLERSSASTMLAKRADSYDIAWEQVNGHSLYDVRAKTWEAIERAHNECLPTVIEMATYRHRGHSVSDNEKYRDKEETEKYKRTSDPVILFQDTLIDEKVLTEDLIKKINTEAREEAEKSAQFADQSPFPPEEELLKDVYWEEDNPEHKTSQGKIFFND